MDRSAVRADNTSGGLEAPWPDFGLTVTPKAGNCCTLMRSNLAGQRLISLAMTACVYTYGSVSVSLRRFWVDCHQDRFRRAG